LRLSLYRAGLPGLGCSERDPGAWRVVLVAGRERAGLRPHDHQVRPYAGTAHVRRHDATGVAQSTLYTESGFVPRLEAEVSLFTSLRFPTMGDSRLIDRDATLAFPRAL